MRYNEFKYLWPPRPDAKIPQSAIKMFERKKYAAQVKKNGTCNIVFANANEVIFKMRHGPDSDHLQWKPTQFHEDWFKNEAKKVGGGWCVYVSELLHSKTPHIKDTIYIFDQIVRNGESLVGTSFGDRQQMLMNDLVHEDSEEARDHYILASKGKQGTIVLAKTFLEGYADIFNNLEAEDEGLVLKRWDAKLEAPITQKSNNSWQVKCRKPHRNYSF